MKRWRRPFILIPLLLLAGAAINVAVAWGIVAIGAAPEIGIARDWSDDRDSRFALTAGARVGHRGRAPWHVRLDPPGSAAYTICASVGHWQSWEVSDSLRRSAKTFAFGWPRPALRIWSRGPWIIGHRVLNGGVTAPQVLISRGMFRKSFGVVPTSAIPTGFAINTLFYAAIFALPLSAGPIRRRLRTRRGRCPKCGYDRAGLADPATPCPECGADR